MVSCGLLAELAAAVPDGMEADTMKNHSKQYEATSEHGGGVI